MLQIEKVFEKITPSNYSIGSSYINNKIRIKDTNFSIKSIYKILEHFKWMRANMSKCETKIIIDSEYIADQSIITLFESIIYFVINEWKFRVVYRFSLKENLLSYQVFKRSLLYKYNNNSININEYNKEFTQKLSISRDHFRKVCENTEENKKGKFVSVTMNDIDTFLKCFEIDETYREKLSEVIAEILDNALQYSKGDCILSVNALKSDYHKYKYIDVSLVVIDEVFIGKEIIDYIENSDKECYSDKNEIVLKAYNNHKESFNDEYNIKAFAMVSSFQKYVTTRRYTNNTGGTGLTTLIETLIEKASRNFCYVISGNTNLIFNKKFLKLSDDGLIGFNDKNDYVEGIPNKEIVNINKFDMNVNIYNLQFILEENKDE